jgi:leucyl/phenylalanyl-tRNA--protein transferase
MPVFALIDEPVFPKPTLAEPGGLLAVGGDLSLERLLAAYRRGIFPWYDEHSPILWWSPDPRPVLFPWQVQVSRRLERTIRSGKFRVTLDTDFGGVIRGCAGVMRAAGDGTWIVPEMIAAYERLHAAGHAHSVEAWQDGELVGGAYGVAIGKAFFGESMFHRVTDASKVAFVTLARHLDAQGFHFIDCQQTTGHLCRFGAQEVTRNEFLRMLEVARDGEGGVGD